LAAFWILDCYRFFGVLGGLSGSVIERKGLPFAYKLGSLLIASASIILAVTSENWLMA